MNMKHPTLHSSRLAALLLCAVALPACSALSQPYPAKAHFTIDPGSPDPAGADAKPSLQGVLGLERVRVSEPYRSAQFIYRTGPSATEEDFYNVFITPPEEILSATSTDWFVKSRIANATIDLPSPLDCKFTADIEVSELFVDFSKDPAHPKAVISAQFFLLEDNGSVRSIIVQKSTRHEIDAKSKDGAGIADAWNQAWRLTLMDFEKAVRERK